MKPDKMAIFGPNKMFINYIKNVLPDIGVGGIKQITFYEWWKDNIKDNQKNSFKITKSSKRLEGSTLSKFKGSLKFKNIVLQYLNEIENEFNPERFTYILEKINKQVKKEITEFESEFSLDLDIKNYIYEDISQKIKKFYMVDYAYLPLQVRRERILRNIQNEKKDFIKSIINKFENVIQISHLGTIKNKLNKFITEGINVFEMNWKNVSSLDLYFNLIGNKTILERYIENNNNLIEKVVYETKNQLKNKYIQDTDLAGIFVIDDYINTRFLQSDFKKFDYLVIDEGQDYNPFEIFLLTNIVKKGRFTILGDLGQTIYSNRSINDWNEVVESIKESIDMKPNYLELSLTYRSTSQITEYSNNIINPWSKGKYNLSTPFGRDGNPPKVKKGLKSVEKYQEVQKAINQYQEKGLKNIAILTRDFESVKLAKKELFSINSLEEFVTDSRIYEGGLIIMPVTLSKGMEFDAVIIYDSDKYNIERFELDRKLLYVGCTRALHELLLL